jgi:hypothetical protein
MHLNAGMPFEPATKLTVFNEISFLAERIDQTTHRFGIP